MCTSCSVTWHHIAQLLLLSMVHELVLRTMPSRIQTKGIGSRPSWCDKQTLTSMLASTNHALYLPTFIRWKTILCALAFSAYFFGTLQWFTSFGGPKVTLLGFGDQISAASPPRCQVWSPGKWQVASIVTRKWSSQWKRSRCTRSHNTSKVQSSDQTLILQRNVEIQKSMAWKHLDSGIQKNNTSTIALLIPIQVSQRRAPSSALATHGSLRNKGLGTKKKHKTRGFLSKHFELCSDICNLATGCIDLHASLGC